MIKQTAREKKVFDDLSSNRSKYGEHLDIDTLTKEWRDDPLMDLSIQQLKLSDHNEIAPQSSRNLTIPKAKEFVLSKPQASPNILTNEYLKSHFQLLSASAAQSKANAFDISVEKLDKAPLAEDSILSPNKRKNRESENSSMIHRENLHFKNVLNFDKKMTLKKSEVTNLHKNQRLKQIRVNFSDNQSQFQQ